MSILLAHFFNNSYTSRATSPLLVALIMRGVNLLWRSFFVTFLTTILAHKKVAFGGVFIL